MAIAPDVLILPTYDDAESIPSETEPWRDVYDFENSIEIRGVPSPLEYTDTGIGLVPTGITKTASCTTMTALLASERVDLTDTLLLTVGVAGAPPRLPIGSVVISETIVDWDDKCRVGPDAEEIPLLVNPYSTGEGVYELDAEFVERASALAANVELPQQPEDGSAVSTPPVVRTGTNVSADEFWHGEALAQQVEWLVDQYGASPYCVTEVEDAGTATALERFDRLDQYLSIRGVSNYDRPTTERTPRENVFTGEFEAGFTAGLENAIAVARPVIEEWLSE